MAYPAVLWTIYLFPRTKPTVQKNVGLAGSKKQMYIGHDRMELTISCDWHVHLDGPRLHHDIWTTVNIIFTQGGFGTWGAHKVS